MCEKCKAEDAVLLASLTREVETLFNEPAFVELNLTKEQLAVLTKEISLFSLDLVLETEATIRMSNLVKKLFGPDVIKLFVGAGLGKTPPEDFPPSVTKGPFDLTPND